MKNKFLSMLIALIFGAAFITASCGGEEKEDDTDTATEVKEDKTDDVKEDKTDESDETASADFSKGKKIFTNNCQTCHMAEGTGVEGTFPPLAGSDYLNDTKAVINAIVNGLEGEITVNGKTYNTPMAPVELSNEEIVEVVNYVYNSWGNEFGTITLEDVKAAKGE